MIPSHATSTAKKNDLYSLLMSTPPAATSAPSARTREHFSTHVRNFWQRVSEGRQIDDLWTQFAADARASYGFYGSDVDWDEIKKLPRWRQPLHVAKQFFWALLLKLTPARRILLLAALVMLIFSGIKVLDIRFEFLAAAVFLLLLSLELADKVTMKRDLEIAREIQTWLVPSSPPQVPGAEIAFASRPQNSVAGDYYDAFFATTAAAEGGKLMLVIADVAGKSIPAALLMATLQASLRTIAGEGAVNAGHNAPILRRANGDMEKLDIGGVPLGIQSAAAYETSAKDLRPGDALIFFTDGVVEAFDESGQEFGDGRWLAAIRGLPEISAQESLQFLMTNVDAFVGATRQSDDITCMIFRAKRTA